MRVSIGQSYIIISKLFWRVLLKISLGKCYSIVPRTFQVLEIIIFYSDATIVVSGVITSPYFYNLCPFEWFGPDFGRKIVIYTINYVNS